MQNSHKSYCISIAAKEKKFAKIYDFCLTSRGIDARLSPISYILYERSRPVTQSTAEKTNSNAKSYATAGFTCASAAASSILVIRSLNVKTLSVFLVSVAVLLISLIIIRLGLYRKEPDTERT